MALAIIDDLGGWPRLSRRFIPTTRPPARAAAAAIVWCQVLTRAACGAPDSYLLARCCGRRCWKFAFTCDPCRVIVGFMIPLEEKHGKSPAKAPQHVLHPWVAKLMILLLFGLAKRASHLQGSPCRADVAPAAGHYGWPVYRYAGDSLFCWLALKLKWARHGGNHLQANYGGGRSCAGLALRCRFSSPPPLAAWIPR